MRKPEIWPETEKEPLFAFFELVPQLWNGFARGLI
jgi:hypothetical protein